MEDTQNELEQMRTALKKANEEAKTARLERNALQEQLTESEKFRTGFIQMKAEKTLSEAGITNGKAARFLDLSKVTVMDTGELEGLDEQLATLKEDLPELFGAGGKEVSGGTDAANKKEARPQKSSADIIAERLRG